MSDRPVGTTPVAIPARADSEAAYTGKNDACEAGSQLAPGPTEPARSRIEPAPSRPEDSPAACSEMPQAGLSRLRTEIEAGAKRLSHRPLWSEIPVPAGYELDERGVSQTTTATRIAGPAWVKATTHDPISGDHGIVIAWHDPFGAPHELAVTRDELHGQGSTLAARLSRGGLWIMPGTERKVLQYLAEFDVLRVPRWAAVTRVGWIEREDGQLAYMLPPPRGLVALDSQPPVIFQPERESPSSASLYSRGTLADWNASVVSLCKDNPLLLFPVLIGLSGPLLRFAEMESGGFHYYGRSSHGKTTAAQVAASVWGNGADPAESPDRAYVQKWNSTANAFEALLCGHNDSLLVLDEIHTCDTKDFAAVIYNMASGKGKQSLDRERQLRRPRRWRAIYFSTGEVSVLSKLQADGKAVHAGQLLRLVDIPIERGIITHTGDMHPAAYADRLKSSCSRSFGTAGPALIETLVREYEGTGKLVGTIKTKVEHYSGVLTPKDAPPEIRRAIKRFALTMVAGELAIQLGILDCTMMHVGAAARTALRAWLTNGENVPDRLRGLMNVAEFIQRHESRFQSLGSVHAYPPRDRAGFVGFDKTTGEQQYQFTREGFAEACGGLDPKETASELKERGFLVAERGRLTDKRDTGNGRTRLYVVRAALLEFDPVSWTGDIGTADCTGATGARGAAN